MNELVIEDKKYVSSKRAAEITGYAKDYIGQLSREGRIPARLVGRSWYVLESALKDHRFGTESEESEGIEEKTSASTLPSTWESPRYQTVQAEILPSVNRLTVMDVVPAVEEENASKGNFEPQEHHSLIQNAWKEWFSGSPAPVSKEEESEVESKEIKTNGNKDSEVVEEEEIVPIRAIHHAPIGETVNLRRRGESYEEVQSVAAYDAPADALHIPKGRSYAGLRISAAVLGIVAVFVGVIGTGHADSYLGSNKQVSLLAGVSVYKK